MRLIRDREIEIENFKPDEYWNIDALLHPQGEKGEFTARLAATADGKKLTVTDKQQADAYLELYCDRADVPMQVVRQWMSIVAAAELSRKRTDVNDEFLMSWIDVVDYMG